MPTLSELEEARRVMYERKAEAEAAATDFYTMAWDVQLGGVGVSEMARHFDVSRQAVYEWISRAEVRRPA